MDTNEMLAGLIAASTRTNGTHVLTNEQAKAIVKELTIQQFSDCLEKLNQNLPFISSASRMDSFLNLCMQSLKQSNPQHPLLVCPETTKHHSQAPFESLLDQGCPDYAKFSQGQTKHGEVPQFEHLSVDQTKAVHHLLTQTLKHLSVILQNS